MKPHPADVQAVMASNRPRLLATIATVQAALANRAAQPKPRKQ